MQKMMCVVIEVDKFCQEFFIIGIFLTFLYKHLKTILAKAVLNTFWQHAEDHMQPLQIKPHPHEMFYTLQK